MPTARTYVALLRGINVGGKNSLPMQRLAALCNDAGCSDVRTHIQSGNVIFNADPKRADALPAEIARRIQKAAGFSAPVVLRSADELAKLVRDNPFLKAGVDADILHVAFLADAPSKAQVAALDPKRSPGDTFKVIGRDIYLALPNGVGKTKLSNAYFDSKLGTVSTLRNWRTVLKLLELSAGS